MAEKLKPDTEKPTRKEKKEGPGMGHNLVEIRRKAEPAMKKLLALQKDMDSDMGGYKADFKKLYEESAGEIGCKPSVLRKQFRLLLANIRQEETEQQMDPVEREETETLRAAFAGTEFEAYLDRKLAKPKG
jgi:hypothetical protein